jgi:RNA polymerase I-specific transcription initiation factor RRN3
LSFFPQDGFHDPAAFAAATQHGHSLRRLQQQLAAAANGSSGSAKRPPVDETADKLDSLMEMTFIHLQWRVDAGQLGAVWQTMLTAFERTLLHAHRCKFTQYLLFFLALKDPARCCSSFSACLMSLLRDARQPPITRSACAAYLASFLARCALAPKELVVDVIGKLASCCQEYADNIMQQQQQGGLGGRSSSSSGLVLLQSNGSSNSNGAGAGQLAQVQRHQAFYAMVQALLYVLCYHMQPLLGAQLQQLQQQQQQDSQQPAAQQQQQLAASVEQLVRQQVLPLLSHPLAPLAVCHQAVTHEFVRQALLLGLADLSWEAAAVEAVAAHQAAVAAANAAAAAVVIGGDGGGDASSQVRGVLRPLEVFFPFDPYLLQRSSRFLELGRSYMCFSHGQPHVAGDEALAAAAAEQQAANGAAGVADSDGSSSEGESDSEDEGEEALLRRAAAAAAAAGSSPRTNGVLSGDEDDSSSSDSEDEADEPAAAAGAAAVGDRGRQRSGLMPVGFAAAAARGQAGLGLSGPSPPADMMATSLVAAPYLAGMGMGGISFSPGEAAMADHIGASPYGVSPGMAMPMSYTYEGAYMQNLPARS